MVEHPARLPCGTALALREFAPSYKRATILQASLALAGLALGLAAAWQLHDQLVVLRAVLLGSVVPYTLIVILPTNKRLLDPALEAKLDRAAELLARWNQLHAVRTALSGVAFVLLLRRVAADASR